MNASRTTLVLCVLVFHAASLAAPTPPPTAATRDLLDLNPGLKAMVEGYKVIALYGPTFYSGTDAPRDLADSFLASNPDALGVYGVVLVFRKEADSGNGEFTAVSYTQEIDGLPVHNSPVTIAVFLGSPNTISYIGIRLVHPPDPSLPAGGVDETAAKAVVTAAYGFTTFSALEEVIYEADDDVIHRAWRFTGWDDDEAYLFFVDTTSGEIVGAVNQVLSSDVSVTVTGHATQGSAADGPVVKVVLPGVQVDVLSAFSPSECGECPNYDDLSGEPYTDASGRQSFSGVGAGDTLSANLVGEWITVYDCGGSRCVPGEGAPVSACEELRTPCAEDNDCTVGDTCDDSPTCDAGNVCSNDSCLSCIAHEDCHFCDTSLAPVASTPCLDDSYCTLPETCDDIQECAAGLCSLSGLVCSMIPTAGCAVLSCHSTLQRMPSVRRL